MEEAKLVTSPKIDRALRDRVNIITKELRLGKFSNAVGFLVAIFDLLFEGTGIKDHEEMIIFIQNLKKDNELLARENYELSLKLKKLQKIIEE